MNDDDDHHQDDQRRRSVFDQQSSEWSQSLQRHRLFWKQLPEQICRINGVSTDEQQTCWSGTSSSLDEDQKYVVSFILSRSKIKTIEQFRSIYEKPLNLKLQWILKELREKSRQIGSIRRITSTSRRTTAGRLLSFISFSFVYQ